MCAGLCFCVCPCYCVCFCLCVCLCLCVCTGAWAEWGDWTECDSSSSNAKKFRFRDLKIGKQAQAPHLNKKMNMNFRFRNCPSTTPCNGDQMETSMCSSEPQSQSICENTHHTGYRELEIWLNWPMFLFSMAGRSFLLVGSEWSDSSLVVVSLCKCSLIDCQEIETPARSTSLRACSPRSTSPRQ